MSRRGWIIVATVAAAMVAAALSRNMTPGISPGELARRCSASHPTWPDYEEDIKGQIGAAPAAEWAGAPVEAERKDGAIRIAWRIEPPWAQRDCGIPILLREPHGTIARNTLVERKQDVMIYVFDLPPQVGTAELPWIEVKYPRGEQRLVLSSDGSWKAP